MISAPNETVVINVQVLPKSGRSMITVLEDGSIKVFLNSPPVDGKANRECVELFSKVCGIPKSKVIIDKGENSRRKKIILHGISLEVLMQKIH
jgi:uncharacterized protein (TIGR00251 family)